MGLNVGDAVSKSLRLYVKLFGVLIGAALVVNTVIAFLEEAIVADSSTGFMRQLGDLIALAVLSLVAASLITALSTHAVGDMEDGERDFGMGELFSRAGPVIAAVIGVSVLQGIGIAIGFMLLLVPGILALVWWSVAVPAVVVERPGVFAAFGRSIALVRGNAWSVFGYGLLMILLFIIGSAAVGFALALVQLTDLVGPMVAGIVADSVMTPFGAVGYAVLYYELRRAEGPQSLESETWEDPTT